MLLWLNRTGSGDKSLAFYSSSLSIHASPIKSCYQHLPLKVMWARYWKCLIQGLTQSKTQRVCWIRMQSRKRGHLNQSLMKMIRPNSWILSLACSTTYTEFILKKKKRQNFAFNFTYSFKNTSIKIIYIRTWQIILERTQFLSKETRIQILLFFPVY